MFWWLYVIAVLAVYSGMLVSRLSTVKTVLPFHNLTEFVGVLKEGSYKLCVTDGTSLYDSIKVIKFFFNVIRCTGE